MMEKKGKRKRDTPRELEEGRKIEADEQANLQIKESLGKKEESQSEIQIKR